MKHEAKAGYYPEYYDTMDELPKEVNVKFPHSDKWVKMTEDEVKKLDGKYWTIMHSVNWGSCDHWTSEKPSYWLKEEFNKVYHYKYQGKFLGYNRRSYDLKLTEESNFFKAEVWDS